MHIQQLGLGSQSPLQKLEINIQLPKRGRKLQSLQAHSPNI